MPLHNPPPVVVPNSSTSTPFTRTLVAGTALLLIAANVNRKNLTLYNNGLFPIHVDYVSTVSATVFAFILHPGVYYEMPHDGVFTGELHGVSIGGAGSCLVREFV